MLRTNLFLLMVLTLATTAHASVRPASSVAEKATVREMYRAFLERWTENGNGSINISRDVRAPTTDELDQLSECAGHERWAGTSGSADLADVFGDLPYVHLIDPKDWRSKDPGRSIAQGQSVAAAVESGMAHGLMSFSTVVFNKARTVAAFEYAFVCGELCGNGGPVVFIKHDGRWFQSAKRCGGWISSSRPGKQKNSVAQSASFTARANRPRRDAFFRSTL